MSAPEHPAPGEPSRVDPTVRTAPTPEEQPRRWWSAVPATLGRVRTSTVVLVLLFLAIGALYLNVRPDRPGTTAGTGGTGTEPAPTTAGTPPPTTTVPPSPTDPGPTTEEETTDGETTDEETTDEETTDEEPTTDEGGTTGEEPTGEDATTSPPDPDDDPDGTAPSAPGTTGPAPTTGG